MVLDLAVVAVAVDADVVADFVDFVAVSERMHPLA